MNKILVCKMIFILSMLYMHVVAEEIKKEPKASEPKCASCEVASGSFTESSWIERTKRIQGPSEKIVFTNQSGTVLKGKEIFDRPTVITFLYTKCDNPNKCPLVASTMAKLQELLQVEGLEASTRLCIITYDPEQDSPDVLKNYAREFGIKCNDNALMLRPEPKQKEEFFKSMEVLVNYEQKRVNIHGIQMLLLDEEGRLAKSYHTLIWDNSAVVKDLRKLLLEKK